MSKYIGATAVNLSTTSADVTGNADIGGNLTVDGNLTVSGTTTTIDSASAQTVDLGDNDKIRLGDGDDLQIYHNGTASFIDDAGTGDLNIRAAGAVAIDKYTGEAMARFYQDAGVYLYYNNAAKFETTNTGVSVTGALKVSASSVVTASTDADDLVIEKTGDTGLSILSTTTGRIYFGDAANDDAGSIRYVHSDNSMRFETDDVERLRIDSSGNVGIGNSSMSSYYSDRLVVGVGDEDGITIAGSPTHQNYIMFADGTSGDARYKGYISYDHNVDTMKLATNGATRLQIDSAGRAGLGVTPAAVSDSTGATSLQAGGTFLIHFDPDGPGTTSLNNNVYWDGSNNKALFSGYTSQYYQNGGAHHFRRSGSTSAGGTVSNVEIVRFDGDGIKFNGDTAAANALSDYERGLHTISINQGGIGFNSLYQNFQYVKIGHLVNIHGLLLVSSSGDSNVLKINMPFTARSGLSQTADATHGLVSSYNVPTGSGGIRCTISKGTNKLRFLKTVDNGVWTSLLGNELANGDHLYVNISYEVA